MSLVSLVVRRASRDDATSAPLEALLTLRPSSSLDALKAAVRQAFAPELDGQQFELTDLSSPPLADDAAATRVLLRASGSGSDAPVALWVVSSVTQALGGVAKERVTFAPHPKTMTMAGDYEYYAAQGRQPLAFAVAELVDNALRATAGSIAETANSSSCSQSSTTAPRIEVTVALDSEDAPTAGLVSVWDNGAGMSKAALNAWAVMNLAVSERCDEGGGNGATNDENNNNLNVSSSPALAPAPDALASARHLNGDLSYFGVGSKNAAFFLGRRVGVATSRRGEGAVRELALDAVALEARYQQQAAAASGHGGKEEAVYADDLVHRDPGDPSTLLEVTAAAAAGAAPSLIAAPFSAPSPPSPSALALLRSLEQQWVSSEPAGDQAPAAHWTRVTVSSLKAPVLRQLADDRGGTRLCGALAHLYHYYLHGARGRTKCGSGGGGEANTTSKTTAASNPLPEIVVRGVVAGKQAWECRLGDVKHDLESRSLATAASEFEFCLHVPGKAAAGADGIVAGVLRYFPFEGERETVPDAIADADAAAAASSAAIASAAAAGLKRKQKKRPASGGGGNAGGGGRGLALRRSSGGGSDIAGGAIDMTQVGSGALTQRMQQQQLTQARVGGVSAIDKGAGGGEEAAAVADAEAAAAAAVFEEEEEAAGPIDDTNEDDAAVAAAATAAALARLRGPCLEAFWQGRLIPGARVESLPFVDAVRSRARQAGGAARDAVPDEVFGRLRGALFFGPAWLVTRNKLTFRDDLRGLLSAATGERSVVVGGGNGATTATAANGGASLERRFREWLARCHATLDKRVRYEQPAPPRVQASAREAHGEAISVFERASEGGVAVVSAASSFSSSPSPNSTTYSVGDLVRLAVKPAIVGKVLYFHVPIVGASAGAHGGGFVTVAPLPEKLWGGETRTFPFRRLASSSSNEESGGEAAQRPSAYVSEKEAAAHCARELSRAPSAARLVEPLRLAASDSRHMMSLAAGAALPETGVAALAGGGSGSVDAASTRITRAMLAGRRVPLVMVQRLWFLGGNGNGGGNEEVGDEAEAMEGEDAEAPAEAPAASAAAASKKSRRGARKVKVGAAAAAAEEEEEEEAAAAAAATAPSPPPAASSSSSRTLVLEVENRTPSRDGLFRFSKVSDGLRRAGRYELEYELLPRLPGGGGGEAGDSSSNRISTRVALDVAPGPAATLQASGPGRAAASAGPPLPLGAPLPALELVYRDEFGNAARPPKAVLKGVALSVVRGGRGGGAAGGGDDEEEAAIGDLRALSTAVDATASGATLSRVRVVGAEGVTAGVSIFSPSSVVEEGEEDDDDEPRGAQPGAGGGGAAALLLRGPASVSLLVSAPLSFASSSSSRDSSASLSVRLPLRLLPGAPVALRISAEEGEGVGASSVAGLLAAGVPAGAPLPAFSVSAVDAWGNRTAPFEGVFSFELEVASPLVQGGPAAEGCMAGRRRFSFDANGTARVEGLTVVAAAADTPSSSSHPLVLSLVVKPLCPAAADAVDGAGPAAPLSLPLQVQPSRAPARLQLLLDGRPLPMLSEGGGGAAAAKKNNSNNKVDDDEEANDNSGDDAPSALLAGVPAGSSVSGLSLRVLDAAGRPCDPSLPGSGLDGPEATGKLQVSWMRGHKKVKASDLACSSSSSDGGGGGEEAGRAGAGIAGGLITLPPLEAPERVGEDASFWVRLKFSGRGAPLLEAGLAVACSPGAPRSWQLRLVDGGKGGGSGDVEGEAQATTAAAAANKKSSASSSSEGDIFAGVPFVLEAEALDEFANRCPFDAAAVPMPRLSVARLPGGGGGNGSGGSGGGGRGRKNSGNNASSDTAAPWLECDTAAWDGTWTPVSSSAGGGGSSGEESLGDVFTARGVIRGSTGRLLLEVRDDGDGSGDGDNDESSSTLSPDALELTLGPGPPATLAFDPLPAPFASGKAASTNNAAAAVASIGAAPGASAAALGLALALPPLTVRVLDACGNSVTSGPAANGTDVALLPGALATDGTGRAAAVSAAATAVAGSIVAAASAASSSSSSGGAIKARLVDGVATFENVRVSAAVPPTAAAAGEGGGSRPSKKGGSAASAAATVASDPFSLARAAAAAAAAAAVSGCYALRAKPASRSLAAAFGELEVFLAPSNAVVRVSIRGGLALPGNDGGVEQQQQNKGGRGKAAVAAPTSSSVATLISGSTATFIVDVATEDGVPLTAEVAAAGLRLCLIEQSGGGGGAGGDGSNNSHVTSTPLALDASAPTPLPGGGGASFSISSAEPICKSGRYAVSAEWSEPRADVAAAAQWRAPTAATAATAASNGGSPSSPSLLRSTAVELVVSAGPAVSLLLDPAPVSAAQQQLSGKRRGGGRVSSDSPPPPPPPSLTASNGGGEAARSVLPRPVALQLVDEHGNAVAKAGVKVRLALVLAGGDSSNANAAAGGGGRGGRGKRAASATTTTSSSAVPLLEGAAAEEHETDERGRAFIGAVRIAEGTGGGGGGEVSTAAAPAARSLDLRLVALFATTAAAEQGGNAGDSAALSFVEALSLPLLFTDGGALAEAIAAAASERDTARAAADELEGKVAEARAATVAAERAAAAAARAVSAARRAVGGGKSAPDSPGAAKAALEAALQQRAAEEASRGGGGGKQQRKDKQQQRKEKQQQLLQQLDLAASHGPAGKPMTKSVDACLADGGGSGGSGAGGASSSSSSSTIPGVVGVFARLATVDDARLSAVLAAQYRGLLPVVVVRDPQARTALAAARSGDSLPTPDILALTHVQPFRAAGPVPEDAKSKSILLPHRSRSASALARTLVAAACQGSDAPLPFPLPHAKVLLTHGARKKAQQQGQQQPSSSSSLALVAAAPPKGVPAADEWPEGCLGYAFNLVRPTKKGARAALLYPLLGQTLVFESLETGSAYREHLATRLRAGCGDIVSLDGGRVSSKGVTSGSGFAVPPAGSVPWRFGSTPANQRPRIEEEEEEEEEGEEEAEACDGDSAAPAALEALVAALEARAGADSRLAEARERGQRVEGRLLPRLEAAARALEEAEARIQELRSGNGNEEEGEQEEEEQAEEQENEAPAAKGGKRRAPLQLESSKTPQAAAAAASNKANNNINNKRMRKMAA